MRENKAKQKREMSTKSTNIKGFYKQKKNTKTSSSGVAKKKPSATFGSNVTQPPALVSHGGSLDLKDDYDQKEEMLRQFDMNMAYGPCLGMTRLERWERACRLGLNPPKEIESLLKTQKVQLECLWEGCV